MEDTGIRLTPESLHELYGSAFYLMEQPEGVRSLGREKAFQGPPVADAASGDTGHGNAITWRPKPTSKLLFVLHQAELRDKSLGELLKKIVASIGIPFESAGFGIITGTVSELSFHSMPNQLAVVFDRNLAFGNQNPHIAEFGEIFFAHRLAELESEKAHKVELWNYLKSIQSRVI